jgi:hypothetical protein
LPEAEFLTLTPYAAAARRTKTEIIREFVRSLEPILETRAKATAAKR